MILTTVLEMVIIFILHGVDCGADPNHTICLCLTVTVCEMMSQLHCLLERCRDKEKEA